MSPITIIFDVLLVAAAALLVVWVLGALARLLLGARMSLPRLPLAGAVGLGAGVGFESRFVWSAAEYMPAMIPILVGVTLLVAIAVLVVAEIVAPAGSLPNPGQWPGLVRTALARHRRYLQLLRIVARHRLHTMRLEPPRTAAQREEQRRQAESLKLSLEEAGGAFVKLSQMLSTRPDVLPPIYGEVLATLQEQVPSAPWPEVAAELERALGAPRATVFAEFDETPLAAASIGQVHAAVLPTGERVEVKVRRPGIVQVVQRDLDIARQLTRRFVESADWARRLGLERLVDGLAEGLLDEPDYAREAESKVALAAVQERLPAEARVRIPGCRADLSGEAVLVMEFVDAPTLGDAAAVSALSPALRRRVADQLLGADWRGPNSTAPRSRVPRYQAA